MCLYRVARVASRFGDAACGILISACVECSRAGDTFQKQSYQCACVLLKEYNDEIPEKYRKPIEQIVRRRKTFAESDIKLNCCQCMEAMPAGQLSCDTC